MSLSAPTIVWAGLAPVLTVLGAAVLGVLVEALVPRKARLVTQSVLAVLAILLSGVFLAGRWSLMRAEPTANALTTGLSEDPFAIAAQGALLVIGLLGIAVMADRTSAQDGAFAAQAADRPGSAEEAESLRAGWMSTEIFPLALFSLGGMMAFPMATDYIALFVLLELISLPLYIMAATARHRRLLSQEAALKYFVLGAFASAFLLMGAALLYGVTGSLDYRLAAIAASPAGPLGMDWLLLAGVALVLIGLLFKVAAVPFHSWSPDVYQGAPTPVTGFMAAGVKAAAFLVMVRFVAGVAGFFTWDLTPMLWTISILTMLVGTVVGLVQSDIKRMLAYSAIAHAGYMLIGVIASGMNTAGVSALLFYSLTYGVATIGAFAVITLIRVNHDGAAGAEATSLKTLAGLGRRSPALAVALSIFLLSFAGIPLTAGFIGKFLLFGAGLQTDAVWLVVAAVISSAATAFFYFRVIVLMFFREPDEEEVLLVRSTGPVAAVIIVAAALTILLGVLPQAVLDLASQAAMLGL